MQRCSTYRLTGAFHSVLLATRPLHQPGTLRARPIPSSCCVSSICLCFLPSLVPWSLGPLVPWSLAGRGPLICSALSASCLHLSQSSASLSHSRLFTSALFEISIDTIAIFCYSFDTGPSVLISVFLVSLHHSLLLSTLSLSTSHSLYRSCTSQSALHLPFGNAIYVKWGLSDGIFVKIIKYAKPVLYTKLRELICQCWEDGTLPRDMRDPIVITLYKTRVTAATVTTTAVSFCSAL